MRSAVISTICAITVALPLRAQQRTALDSLAADTAHARRLGRIVVSGARLTTAADPRVPMSTQRIELAAAGRHHEATDVLARVPGMSVSNDQGSHAQPSFDLRGFTLSPVVGAPQGVSVFLDGVRVNEPDAQEVNFDLLPMDAVEGAELIRGPSAVFGKNSLAGSLLLTTARGAQPGMDGEIGVGSFGEREGHLRASGMLGGTDALLLVSASGDDGYQVRSGARTRQLFATIGRKREGADVALSLLVARNRIYEAGSLPESWLAETRRANYTGGDFFHPELTQLSARGSWQLGAASLRATAFGRRNVIEQLNVNAGDANTHAFVTNGSAGGTAELGFATTLGTRSLDLSLGVDASHSQVKYLVQAEPNVDTPALPDDCAPAPGGASALCEDARANGDDAAIYAQGILQVTPRLAVTASARGDWSRVPFRDHRDASNDGTSVFARLSPMLGASYVVGHARVYANVGSAFRAPAALELACASPEASCPLPFSLGDDPPLRPVVAWNYETGTEWADGRGASLAISLFDTEVRDDIVFASASQTTGYFRNVARTRRQGVETRISLLLPATSRLFGSWTLLDATYRVPITLASALGANDVSPGDRFALSPRHRATVGLSSSHMAGTAQVDATLTAHGVSSSWLRGDEGNAHTALAGYILADFATAVHLGSVTVSATVTNLLDRRYALYGVYAENSKGPYGGPATDAPVVERFLTPGYPRALRVGVGFSSF